MIRTHKITIDFYGKEHVYDVEASSVRVATELAMNEAVDDLRVENAEQIVEE